MLSRVADAIYWMSRNVERAENIARFLEVTQDFALDTPASEEGGEHEQWGPLVAVTGEQAWFKERYEKVNADSVVDFLVLNRDYQNSIASLLVMARENARSVRETIASELWESLNEFYQWFNAEVASGQPWRAPSEFYRAIMRQATLFQGVADATMTRDQGWHFVNLGRQLERADQISRLLDVKYFTLLPNPEDVNTPVDDLQWSALLKSVSGFEMYRKLYQEVTVNEVIGFLVLSRSFPRAIHYCLAEANRSLHAITRCPVGEYSNPAEQTLGRLCADLAFTDANAIIARGLHEFVDDLQLKLNAVGDGVFDAFFAMRPIGAPASPEPMAMTQTQSQG